MSESSSRAPEEDRLHHAGQRTSTRSKSMGSIQQITRKLGLKLTPVVLDLGVGQPRFASYLEWNEATRTALLSPVAGEGLRVALTGTHDRIRIRSADPSEPWMLTVGAVRLIDARSAELDLTHGIVTRLRDRIPGRTLAVGREPLVLVVHAGPASIEGHVFPITGLGASHCLVDATQPLDPRDGLDLVEVIGERRIIRRASARVLEVIPWVTALGERRFRCRLLFEPPKSVTAVDEGYDLLCDAERIGRLFDLATMVDLAGWYDAPGWPRAAMRIVEVRDGLIVLNVDELPPPDIIPLPDEIRIGFELFSVSYEGRVRLHRRRGGKLDVALPFVMRRCRRRREQRAHVPQSSTLTVLFRNSASGELARRRVRDLSFGGLCFQGDPASDVLWEGACLEGAWLESDRGTVALGDLEVRAIEHTAAGETRCHVANRGTAPAENPVLIDLLATLYHPLAERHDGVDFRMMVDLYERAGLLGDFMLRNLRPVLPAAAATWRKLHDKESSVACTLLFRGESSKPCAAFSGVRVWERTWLAQHFGAVASADKRATGTLQLAYVDFVMPQPDTHYMAFFVKTGNARMNAFYEKFFELTGTAESVSRMTLGLWMLPHGGSAAAGPVFGQYHVRPMTPLDEIVVSRAAEQTFGVMAATALSFVPDAFDLPDTSRRFARLQLERTRAAFVVAGHEHERPTLALLKERTSPGVNLTWMLDSWWLLPVGGPDETAAAAAAAHIAAAPADRPEGDKFVIVPHGVATGALRDAGFVNLLDAHLYVLNRSGLRRYYEYISDRYGELGARVTRQAARARTAS